DHGKIDLLAKHSRTGAAATLVRHIDRFDAVGIKEALASDMVEASTSGVPPTQGAGIGPAICNEVIDGFDVTACRNHQRRGQLTDLGNDAEAVDGIDVSVAQHRCQKERT